MRPSLRGGSGGRLVPVRGPDLLDSGLLRSGPQAPNSSMPRGPACRIGVAAAVGRSVPSTPPAALSRPAAPRRPRPRGPCRRVIGSGPARRGPHRWWRGRGRRAPSTAFPRLQPTTTPSRARARRGRRGRRARRSLLDWRGHPVSAAMSRVFTGLSCTKVSTQGPWRVSDCTRSNTRPGPSLRRHGHRAVVASASGSTSTIATS